MTHAKSHNHNVPENTGNEQSILKPSSTIEPHSEPIMSKGSPRRRTGDRPTEQPWLGRENVGLQDESSKGQKGVTNLFNVSERKRNC